MVGEAEAAEMEKRGGKSALIGCRIRWWESKPIQHLAVICNSRLF